MQESRQVIVSRNFQKGPDFVAVFVARLSGGDIHGDVYQFEEWTNNQELVAARVTSGNKYDIRKAFVNRLMDLDEDGWKMMGASSGGSEGQRFFDPSRL